MIKLLLVLVGIYIVIDSIYLASKAEGEDRYCVLAKYTGALMAGLYSVFYASTVSELMFGATIGLFMWQETYYRLYEYLQIKHPKFMLYLPKLYELLQTKLKPKYRRKTDKD